MVDPEEEQVLLLPAWVAFAGRELDQLERVPVRIAEINGADPTGIRVPGGKLLDPL